MHGAWKIPEMNRADFHGLHKEIRIIVHVEWREARETELEGRARGRGTAGGGIKFLSVVHGGKHVRNRSRSRSPKSIASERSSYGRSKSAEGPGLTDIPARLIIASTNFIREFFTVPSVSFTLCSSDQRSEMQLVLCEIEASIFFSLICIFLFISRLGVRLSILALQEIIVPFTDRCWNRSRTPPSRTSCWTAPPTGSTTCWSKRSRSGWWATTTVILSPLWWVPRD